MKGTSKQLSVLIVGLLIVSSTAAAGLAGAMAPSQSADHHGQAQVYKKGGHVYLVFGADTHGKPLSEWVQHYQSQSSKQNASSKVVQFQNVSQMNVKNRGGAVAISIDGGHAKALQQSFQSNSNSQVGVSNASNQNAQQDSQSATFHNVDVTIIFAGQDNSHHFDGWTVQQGKQSSQQTANAKVDQYQNVSQKNYNSQSLAFAVATEGSHATAVQQSFQSNNNSQVGIANASNVAGQSANSAGSQSSQQNASANVTQEQNVTQQNINKQGVAVALAIGPDSQATAIQTTTQQNINSQYGAANATNAVTQVVSAGDDGSQHSAGGSGTQTNEQSANASVRQSQDVNQQNLNFQNAAVAIARHKSTAQAYQSSYQTNYNTQVGIANASNSAMQKKVAVSMANKAGDNKKSAFDYAGSNKQLNEQQAEAAVMQSQYVKQLNINKQYSAVAIADHCHTARAFQTNIQSNVNQQVAVSNSSNQNDQSSTGHAGNGHKKPCDPPKQPKQPCDQPKQPQQPCGGSDTQAANASA